MAISTKNIKTALIIIFIMGCMSNIFAQIIDADGDGVPNTNDLCPNTPIGTTVNPYGCPTTIATCDYTTSSFSLKVTGTVPTETRYLLVNSATGIIDQITTTPTFTALVGTKTYMVLAYSYTGTASSLVIGNQLSTVSAACQDFSTALVVKVCVPVDNGNNCDYTTSTVTLKATTPPAGFSTKYVLVNQLGNIRQIVSTPTFTGLSGTNTYNVYAISYAGTVSNLTIGNSLFAVTGTCFDWSLPLSINVCVCKPVICVPMTVTKTK